jgi:uncharacterized protein
MSKMPRNARIRAKSRVFTLVIGCLSPLLLIAAMADDPTDPTGPTGPTNPPAPADPPAVPAPAPSSPPAKIDPTKPLPFQILRKSPKGLLVIPLQVQGQRFEVEVAADDTSRRRGLGGRTRFLPGTGMLFVHTDDAIRGYWMYDCLIDIDVAFLDKEGRIVAMHRMKREAPRRSAEYQDMYQRRLKRYTSLRPARYALEVPPGDLTRLKLEIGQTIQLPKSDLDKIAS